MLDEYLHRDDRDDDKLVEYGDLLGNGAMFKRLGYLLERTVPLAGALVDACRARRTSGINNLDPSVNAGGPILSTWRIRLNVDLGRLGTGTARSTSATCRRTPIRSARTVAR